MSPLIDCSPPKTGVPQIETITCSICKKTMTHDFDGTPKGKHPMIMCVDPECTGFMFKKGW